MKRAISLCLAVFLLFGMIPISAMATEAENKAIQEMEEAVKGCAKAEIRDADGNALEELEVDVQIQQRATGRSTDNNEYVIVCTAKASDTTPWSATDSKDGIVGVLVMVCRDEWGTSNTLISVTGSWSGEDTDTYNRKVTYCYYSVLGSCSPVIKYDNAPRQFEYYPIDYKGFTFKATSYAQIRSTSRSLYLEVATDPRVLS